MTYNPWRCVDEKLVCEEADLGRIATAHGTPCYVYSKSAIVGRFHEYESALGEIPHLVCYAVKANSNLAILSSLAQEGAGFDIVSGGELYRILAAGGDPERTVFSGVGKTSAEIRFALEQRIHSFNCESEFEAGLISQAAVALNRTASIAIRVNPDVNAATHPYISTGLREHKFGIEIDKTAELYERASRFPRVLAEGVSCHIGSQLLETEPLLEAADRILRLVDTLRANGHPIRFLDLGGGLGVPYRIGEEAPSIQQLAEAFKQRLIGRGLTLLLEPGRSIVGEAGVLLTRVLLIKQNGNRTFVVVDAAMNDLLRPALYGAYHEIVPVAQNANDESVTVDVVGPVCETGDFFARNRAMQRVKPGDLLAIKTAGAYGFTLSSNYNSRPRACEVLVSGGQVQLVRRRDTYEDLVRGESIGEI